MMASDAQVAFKFFQDSGLNKGAAAGLVGNFYHESGGFRPDVVKDLPSGRGDGGTAHGIGQWHPDRWTNLQTYTAVGSGNPQQPSFADQLSFAVYELKQRGQWDPLNKITDPTLAAEYVDTNYEVSASRGNPTAEAPRINAAVQLYNTGDIKGSSSEGSGSYTGRIGEIPGQIKNAVVDGWQGFAKDALMNAGIGVLGVIALIVGIVFVVLSTKAGRNVTGTALKVGTVV